MTSDTDGPNDNKNLKWALGGVAAVAVLATIVAAVLLFGGGDSGAPKGAGPDAGSGEQAAGVASAERHRAGRRDHRRPQLCGVDVDQQ